MQDRGLLDPPHFIMATKKFTIADVKPGDAFIHHGHPYVRVNDDTGRVYDFSTGMMCYTDDFNRRDAIIFADIKLDFVTRSAPAGFFDKPAVKVKKR